ncbi:serine/threonine-protein kinase [Demequina sp.]|uniref:serine/threonine-protein kinase n=1 Tax=Demequina sp. TaxID=2050685 RepID=UPI003D0C9A8A
MAARRQSLNPPTLPGYAYVRPLGSGGFADVFLYQQNLPRRVVAVKVLLKPITDPETAMAMAAEADVMAGLSSHPAILTVFEASVAPDGRPYLVMEYCPASMAVRYRSEQIPIAEVLSTGVRIASAVESAHRVGMLHRDIKPSNILVTTYGHSVLSDFGVATASATGEEDMIAMSPPWSAPEVVERRSSGTVASEVWALAATIYTLAAGHAPFDVPGGRRSDEQLKARILRAKYVPVGRDDAPAALDDALAGGLKRLPADRYPSALEFGKALQEVQREMGLPVTELELAGDDWSPADYAADSLGGPTRSTVPVESARQRHDAAGSSHHTRTSTASQVARRATVRRRIAVGAIILGAAIVGVLVTLALVLGD